MTLADDDIDTKEILARFSTNLIVTGGDGCVPPNPLAAYGATLACEAASMLVHLAVARGHVKAILLGLVRCFFSLLIMCLTNVSTFYLWCHFFEKNQNDEHVHKDLFSPNEIGTLNSLFTEFYDARSRSENFFQWVQTLLCNLYSLPI